MAKVELAGIAENEIEADREDDIERAHDQVRAPIGVLEDKGQHRDRDDRDKEPARLTLQRSQGLASSV